MGAMEVVKAADVQIARVQESVFLPVMSMEVAVQRRETIIKFVKQIMVEDQDFGVIPGTSTKPVLLKPGAEKLCNFFGLEPEFTPITEVADWTGSEHNGEPFYYIRYRCRLTRNGQVLGVGEGSCNSWESKYRWRNANRKCPSCNQETIIIGKAEYGGGFLCFKKKGGCGAKFEDTDKRITDQTVGRVTNPDMADVVNTIQKMAQKRALVPATLLATSGSEFFTQDLEDTPEPPDHHRNTPEEQAALAQRRIQETAIPPVATGSARQNRGPAEQPAGGSQETRGDGSTQGVAQSPAEPSTLPPTQATPAPTETQEPAVPVPLRLIFQELQKPGKSREAMLLMKEKLQTVMPANGAEEYARICAKNGLKRGEGMKITSVKAALLEMWALAEFAEEHKSEYVATDADLPAGLFDTSKEASYAND